MPGVNSLSRWPYMTPEPVLRKDHSWYKVPTKKPVFTVSVLDEVNVANKVNIHYGSLLHIKRH